MTPTHTATPPAKWLQTLPGAVITRTLVSWRHLPQVWARTLAPARPNIWTSSTTVTPHPPPQPLPLPPRLLRRHLPPSHRPRPPLSQLQLLVLTQVSQEFNSHFCNHSFFTVSGNRFSAYYVYLVMFAMI